MSRREKSTPGMRPEDWAALDAFGWTPVARRNWEKLSPEAKHAVRAAADAEQAASMAYVEAEDALAAEGFS